MRQNGGGGERGAHRLPALQRGALRSSRTTPGTWKKLLVTTGQRPQKRLRPQGRRPSCGRRSPSFSQAQTVFPLKLDGPRFNQPRAASGSGRCQAQSHTQVSPWGDEGGGSFRIILHSVEAAHFPSHLPSLMPSSWVGGGAGDAQCWAALSPEHVEPVGRAGEGLPFLPRRQPWGPSHQGGQVGGVATLSA